MKERSLKNNNTRHAHTQCPGSHHNLKSTFYSLLCLVVDGADPDCLVLGGNILAKPGPRKDIVSLCVVRMLLVGDVTHALYACETPKGRCDRKSV